VITALQPQSVRTWGESVIRCIGGEPLAVGERRRRRRRRRAAPKTEDLIRGIPLDYSDIFESMKMAVFIPGLKNERQPSR